MRNSLLPLLLAALLAAPALAQDEGEDVPEAPAPKPANTRSYTSLRRVFSCELPKSGWRGFEEETPLGSAAHFLGPAEENGLWRAALHVHFVEKGHPGFVPIDDAVKRSRRSDPLSERTATPVKRWRVARRSARRFEVTETRLLPPDRLPAAPAVLHHFYAYVPAGSDGYFILKLSSSRETYLQHREMFDRFLHSFRILGYP